MLASGVVLHTVTEVVGTRMRRRKFVVLALSPWTVTDVFMQRRGRVEASFDPDAECICLTDVDLVALSPRHGVTTER